MRKWILILAVLGCLAMTGCATVKYNLPLSSVQADWPKIGERTTVYVGDAMLTQGDIVKMKVLIVPDMVKGVCYDIPPGKYTITGDDEIRYYANSTGTSGTVIKAALCDPFVSLTIPKNTPGQLCVQTAFGVHSCYDANFTIAEEEVKVGARLSEIQHLIYSGLEGKIAKFTYVRAGFQNSVSYDLSKSNIINYRGAKIEIHSHDNEQITYTVLQNFIERELRQEMLR